MLLVNFLHLKNEKSWNELTIKIQTKREWEGEGEKQEILAPYTSMMVMIITLYILHRCIIHKFNLDLYVFFSCSWKKIYNCQCRTNKQTNIQVIQSSLRQVKKNYKKNCTILMKLYILVNKNDKMQKGEKKPLLSPWKQWIDEIIILCKRYIYINLLCFKIIFFRYSYITESSFTWIMLHQILQERDRQNHNSSID